MLACVPRHQNFCPQPLVCGTARVLEAAPPPAHEGVSVSTATRYPTPAQLDAFARRTAHSPLSITIFPSTVRVPQHRQLSRTVNGLDTSGLRYSPYAQPPSGGSRGLLAVVKGAATVARAAVKTPDGRRTKHAPPQTPPAYGHPADGAGGGGYGTNGRTRKAYAHSNAAAADGGPSSSGAMATARVQAPPPQDRSGLSDAVRGTLMRHVNAAAAAESRAAAAVAALQGGVARLSPSRQAVAAVARTDSGLMAGAPASRSGLAFSGAVLPTQSAHMATVGYMEAGDYGVWQHKHPHPPHHPQQQQHQQQQHHQLQQPYSQGSLRMFSQGGRGLEGTVGQSPQSCLPQGGSAHPSYRPHPLSGGGAEREQLSSQYAPYLGPSWATPLTDCYTQELALPRDTGPPHPHNCLDPRHHPPHHHRPHQPPRHHRPQGHAPAAQQAYSAEPGACCGSVGPQGPGPGPGPGPGQASVLSSSLRSLESLISEIHPPCIKERMLGRGYEALGQARLLEQHHPHLHHLHPHLHPHLHQHHPSIQLPVYR